MGEEKTPQSTPALRRCSIHELDSSYRIVFMPQGLGDILFFLMYSTQYRRLIPEPRLAVAVIKKHFLELVELFAERIDAVCLIDMEEEPYLRPRMTYFYDAIYNGAPRTHLLEAVRSAMGLPPTARAFLPSPARPEGMDELEAVCGLVPGRTILIAPDAVSCSVDMPTAAWIQVADACRERGFQVFFNTADKNRFGDHPTVFLSMRQTIHFVSDGGGFIGFRSGLCDVIAAFADAKILLVYPNNKRAVDYPGVIGSDVDPNGAYMRYCSLKSIFPRKAISEFVYDRETLLQTVSQEVSAWQRS